MANGQLWYIDSNGVKHRLGGVVTGDLPSYTLEDYNALPVKPTYWIRLDGDDSPIASNQVSHGNGTVKDKLDSLDTSVSGISTRMTTAEGDIDTLETNLSTTFRTATSNNLIPMPYKDAHGTKNGITYDQIDNAEPGDLPGYGSYKINGTASAYTELELTQTDIYLIPGTYRFQGGIGGSSSTYYLQIEVYNSRHVIEKFKNYSMLGKDWTTFTLSEKSRIKVKVIINSGVTVNNIPLFPILERAYYVEEILWDSNKNLKTYLTTPTDVTGITAAYSYIALGANNSYRLGRVVFVSLHFRNSDTSAKSISANVDIVTGFPKAYKNSYISGFSSVASKTFNGIFYINANGALQATAAFTLNAGEYVNFAGCYVTTDN